METECLKISSAKLKIIILAITESKDEDQLRLTKTGSLHNHCLLLNSSVEATPRQKEILGEFLETLNAFL